MGVSQLSRANRERILRCIWEQGPLSRIAVSRSTGLAPATVNRLTASLLAAGLVREAGSDSSTGGRPSLVLEFQERAGLILAVDVADACTDVAVTDLRCRIIDRARHPADPAETGEDRVTSVLDLIRDALARPYADAFVAIGVSVPGPVDVDGTVVFAPSLGWHDVPLGARIAEITDLPTRVENDANLIAVAEQAMGACQGARSLVAVAVFDGVGSGIVEDGRLWRGASGAAGQIGRMLSGPGSLEHRYAEFGDLETHLGIRGLAARGAAAGLLAPDEGPAGVDRLFASSGDPGAPHHALLARVYDEFAVSLVNLSAILSPEAIVFAGLFARWSDLALPEIARRMTGHTVHPPRLEPVSLGPDAAVRGAARIAFDAAGSVEMLVDSVPVTAQAG